MGIDWSQIDPQWAWAAYEPDARRPWNLAAAAHLHRRAGFGADHAQLTESVRLGPAQAVARLLAPESAATASQDADAATPAFEQQMSQMAKAMTAAGDAHRLGGWWLYRMMRTPDPLLEKTTLFWHGHFATSAAKVEDSSLMLQQNNLLRRHALGDFHAMAQAISRDPAMLIYLDSTSNSRVRPNENYARELMELFCLGIGNYTEKDIQQVARAFTGWEVRSKRFHFNPGQHDTGVKQFLGRSGDFNGEDAVRIVVDQPACPRFIAGKLVRYFVMDEPAAPPALIEPLAQLMRDNDMHIGPVVRRILCSNLFFSELAAGRKVRSPIEFALGVLKALDGATDSFELAGQLDKLGQGLFYPPNVKGWDGGRTWINASSLLGRANLARQLLLGGQARFGQSGLASAVQADGQRITGSAEVVDHLSQLLLAVPVPADVRRGLIDLADAKAPHEDQRIGRVVHAMVTLPEYQLA